MSPPDNAREAKKAEILPRVENGEKLRWANRSICQIGGGFWSSMASTVTLALDSDTAPYSIVYRAFTYSLIHHMSHNHLTWPDSARSSAILNTMQSGAGVWPIDPAKPLSKLVNTEEPSHPETPPCSPRRLRERKAREKDLLETPNNKAQLTGQLNSRSKDLSSFQKKSKAISEKTGNLLERLQVENAKWKAKREYLEASQESKKSTKKKKVQYDTIAKFPTQEEIQGMKEKEKPAKEKKRGKAGA
ncbi:hypothetical protein FDECE_7104 [Fusarium decemcellulare]|nr:hypothetical protein FDECE_7104 [Fusarium decemcellulare]